MRTSVPPLLRVVGATILAAACSCSSPSKQVSAAPSIVTTTLPRATVAVPYSAGLEATDGEAPLQWSVSGLPSTLAWLSVDPVSGTLSGTPTQPVLDPPTFKILVTDKVGRTGERSFSLAVGSCEEGAQLDCYYASDSACMKSRTVCSGGAPAPCNGGGLSPDLDSCGSTCSRCQTAPGISVQGTAICQSGACALRCDAPYGDCDRDFSTGCETALNTVENCGACGAACAFANATATCDGGCHFQSCKTGFVDCNGLLDDGCETTAANCSCATLTVSGFVVQSEVNGTYSRSGSVWRNGSASIEYGHIDANTWEILNSAPGRPALCSPPTGVGTSPADCSVWREWTGSGLGFVVVKTAQFTCSQ